MYLSLPSLRRWWSSTRRESLDLLDSLEQVILEIEKTPDTRNSSTGRSVPSHTLKGNSGLLGMGIWRS